MLGIKDIFQKMEYRRERGEGEGRGQKWYRNGRDGRREGMENGRMEGKRKEEE